jgi:NAD(P)-dependent dehydrogenase (short-subunit alcohol dehydrogenase family)
VAPPPEARPGTLDDLPLTADVDRAVRGAAHGHDLAALLDAGGELLVLPARGYAVVRDGAVRQLAARHEDGAATLLRAALASAANVLSMAKQPRSLTGKVVAVTGGGRGIGRAIAQALAREGACVAVGDLDRGSAEQTAATLGAGAIGVGIDVTDHTALIAFLDDVEQRLGPLDVLVNNAGIMSVTPLVDESAESITRQLDLNLRAVIHGTQEAMRRMVPRGTGHIVNMASIAGRSGFPFLATYCATKHGVVGLSEAARVELRGTGVEVSVVMPSVVKTELASGLADSRVKAVEVDDVAREVVSALKRPRFDVFVPRSNGPLVQLTSPLPRRAREAIGRWIKADQALLKTDRSARAAYEARAAASAPAADEERTAV